MNIGSWLVGTVDDDDDQEIRNTELIHCSTPQEAVEMYVDAISSKPNKVVVVPFTPYSFTLVERYELQEKDRR